MIQPGDLIIITSVYNAFVHEKNPDTKVIFTNKIGKVEEIIDWESEKGRKIKKAREDSGKWKDLPIEESKYIVSIYHHDIIGRKGERGVAERGVCLFKAHPKTEKLFFEKMPDWIYKEMLKKCESFDLVLNESEKEKC